MHNSYSLPTLLLVSGKWHVNFFSNYVSTSLLLYWKQHLAIMKMEDQNGWFVWNWKLFSLFRSKMVKNTRLWRNMSQLKWHELKTDGFPARFWKMNPAQGINSHQSRRHIDQSFDCRFFFSRKHYSLFLMLAMHSHLVSNFMRAWGNHRFYHQLWSS